MIELRAPAKINLTLEVIGTRPDDFHEISSVVQTVNLCDRVTLKASKGIEIKSTSPHWEPEKSLLTRAVELMRANCGTSAGVSISVEKRIPLVAGLGGDSSDAAAVLNGLNKFWKCSLSRAELTVLASRLGSDVAFFLNGGTALVKGRGEIITPLKPLSRWWVVLAVPAITRPADKTKLLYDSLTAEHYTDGQKSEALAQRLNRRESFSPALLFNAFEHVAFAKYPGLFNFTEKLLEQSAPHVHLAGSGPTIFCIFKEKTDANKLYQRLKDKNIEAYLALTAVPESK